MSEISLRRSRAGELVASELDGSYELVAQDTERPRGRMERWGEGEPWINAFIGILLVPPFSITLAFYNPSVLSTVLGSVASAAAVGYFALSCRASYLSNRRQEDREELIAELRAAQRRWVEDQGFTIPSGSFEALDFPTSIDSTKDRAYGSARLVDRKTGRAVSVTLMHRAGEGFGLYDSEGRIPNGAY